MAAHAQKGTFVISLDFELYWGMTDVVALERYRANLEGGRRAIPRTLELFERYGVHATWATVGMLAFDTKAALLAALPAERPQYADERLSNYEYLAHTAIGEDEAHDLYHFGASLIRTIQKCRGQEMGSHTFSHYYCLEEGQTAATFSADLEAWKRALAPYGAPLTSLVLPRNQWNEAYAEICAQAGVRAYRGVQSHTLYGARRGAHHSLFVRTVRFLDHYLPLSGDHIYSREEMRRGALTCVPASSFLRPYAPALFFLEPLKLWRIKRAMTRAAREGKLFHLWWHPHNFGLHTSKNLAGLEQILQHFRMLRERYGMESKNMGEVAAALS
jgi:hypothetical protein